jgi:hypothetical protein
MPAGAGKSGECHCNINLQQARHCIAGFFEVEQSLGRNLRAWFCAALPHLASLDQPAALSSPPDNKPDKGGLRGVLEAVRSASDLAGFPALPTPPRPSSCQESVTALHLGRDILHFQLHPFMSNSFCFVPNKHHNRRYDR